MPEKEEREAVQAVLDLILMNVKQAGGREPDLEQMKDMLVAAYRLVRSIQPVPVYVIDEGRNYANN